jgi:hypothetical protein
MTKDLRDGERWTSQQARLKPGITYQRVHPTVDSGRWYQVIDPEPLGFFIEQGGALRFVSWSQFDVRGAE